MPRPFRMWFYPLPALLAIVGFSYVLYGRIQQIRYAFVILILGVLLYLIRARRKRDWPFRPLLPAAAEVRVS